MTPEGIFVLIIIGLMLVALVRELFQPGIILFSALAIFFLVGIIDTKDTLSGFSNKGMITVALLFLVSEGIRLTGALDGIIKRLLPKRKQRIPTLLFKIMLPATFLSAFLNNTPVVVIFAPLIKKWTEKMNLSASKFLIPLSYATIFGGTCTLIGTSTNLVVHGLMLDSGIEGLGMFEIASVGLVISFFGIVYMATIGHKLLYDKRNRQKPMENVGGRRYFFEVVILEGSPFVGKRPMTSLMKELHGYRLVGINKLGCEAIETDRSIHLQANDRVIVSGSALAMEQLVSLKGIGVEGWDNVKDVENKYIYEVVISERFVGVGRQVRNCKLDINYGAEVLALYRNGESITSNVQSTVLRSGDSLILLASERFVDNSQKTKDFYIAIPQKNIAKKKDKRKMWLSGIIALFMVVGASAGKYIFNPSGTPLDMFFFAIAAVLLLFWTRIIPSRSYTDSIRWDILITIGSAFGISAAMQNTGTADWIAKSVIGLVDSWGAVGVLGGILLMTMIFTELITNNAAAALMFPIALAAATQLGVSPRPFFIAICIAASSSFATPIGYQTNLIVKGIGNYKFKDFLRAGLPLNIMVFILAMLLIPIFWPF